MHKILCGLNLMEGMEIDHRNRDRLDNRRDNLRLCSRLQNIANRKKLTIVNGKTTTSKYKGVCRCSEGRPGWRSEIRVNGKKKHLGVFQTEEEAASAYNDEARRIFGDFATLNELL